MGKVPGHYSYKRLEIHNILVHNIKFNNLGFSGTGGVKTPSTDIESDDANIGIPNVKCSIVGSAFIYLPPTGQFFTLALYACPLNGTLIP